MKQVTKILATVTAAAILGATGYAIANETALTASPGYHILTEGDSQTYTTTDPTGCKGITF